MKPPPKIKFTPEGMQKIKADFEMLTKKRIGAIKELQRAREMGDLSENGAYKAARFEVNDIDRQLRRLKYLLRFGEVVTKTNTTTIDFGCHVTLTDGQKELTFTLVDGFESDPQQQKVSFKSPIGRAILGKKTGDKVRVKIPAGEVVYTVVCFE